MNAEQLVYFTYTFGDKFVGKTQALMDEKKSGKFKFLDGTLKLEEGKAYWTQNHPMVTPEITTAFSEGAHCALPRPTVPVKSGREAYTLLQSALVYHILKPKSERFFINPADTLSGEMRNFIDRN